MKEKIITLHQSNNLDILIQTLSILIKKNNNILSEDIIITSSNSIKHYIDKKLSEILGVAFNIQYQSINSFIWNVLHSLHPNLPRNNPYNIQSIKWILMNLFYSKEYNKLLPKKITNIFNNITHSEINTYDFTSNLAILYDQYITFRPKMIDKWVENKLINANDENEKWQMIIWNYLANKISSPNRTELIHILDKILKSNTHKQLKYQKIFVFGQTSLAPLYINALDSLSQIVNVHLLLLNPSKEYWTDVFNKTDNMDNQNLNPLLVYLSKQYRDFFDEINNLNFYKSTFIPAKSDNDTLLHIIQNDIQNFNFPSKININKINDNSLNIISAYSETRELQILKDYILNYLNNNINKHPYDIIVSSPDIEKYIPFIDAIFGTNSIDNYPIKYNILNTKISYKQELLQTIDQILNIINSRFEISKIIPIIENKLILKKFNLNEENIDLIKEIINNLNIHWGWDENDRKQFGDKENLFTFSQAIQRIILGMFLVEQNDKFKLWFDQAPFYCDIYLYDTLTNIINLFNTLGNIYNNFKNNYTIEEWINHIKNLINDLISDSIENQNIKIKFEQELNDLYNNSYIAQFNHKISFKLIYHIISKFLNTPKDVSTRSGGITFCNLLSLRSIPYSFIALLGLNDSNFPREKFKLPFDLIEAYPQKADNSCKDDDKYFFLEIILSAKDSLYLSYIGKNIQNGKNLAPSVLINEIIETIANMTDKNFEYIFNSFIKEYPLQSFSKKYYIKENNFFTYNHKFFEKYNVKTKTNFICNNYKYQLENIDNINTISYLDLIKFWKNPVKYWLSRKYLWKKIIYKKINNDYEPVNFDVYNNYDSLYLQSNNTDCIKINNFLKKQSKLPTGYSDQYFIRKINQNLKLINNDVIKSPKIELQELNIEFNISDFKLNLNILLNNIYEIGQIEFVNSKNEMNLYKKIEYYLKHLFYCCYENKKTYIISTNKTTLLNEIPIDEAKDELSKWIEYYLIGINNPLPFFIQTSFAAQQEMKKNNNSINYPPDKNSNLYQKILATLNKQEIDTLEYKLIFSNNHILDNQLFWTLSEKLLSKLLIML